MQSEVKQQSSNSPDCRCEARDFSQYTSMSLPLRDLDDKDIELECGTVLRQGALVRHTFFGEAIARGVVPKHYLALVRVTVCASRNYIRNVITA